jgi:peroxiredoxin
LPEAKSIKEGHPVMRKLICTGLFVLLTVFAAWEVRAEKLAIGATFDITKLSSVKKTADNTIIAFVPSLTYDCDYASMLTQSFYYYFDRGMAFEGLKKSPVTRIFLVVADKRNEARSHQNIIGGMEVVYDETGSIFSHFGLKAQADKNADSVVVLLDSKQKIALIDENYRAQGEHLKPLEGKLRRLNGIGTRLGNIPTPKSLKVGDRAVDFELSKDQWLSHFRGKVILLSFYPAAFSGTFPKPVEPKEMRAVAQTAPEPKSVDLAVLRSLTEVLGRDEHRKFELQFDPGITSCSFQITALDIEKGANPDSVKRVVVSSSTPALLEQWRQALGTENIIYANDADYSISRRYFSYNLAGYNNRVSVIIDQKGRIAYIDDHFDANDDVLLNAKIEELVAKK